MNKGSSRTSVDTEILVEAHQPHKHCHWIQKQPSKELLRYSMTWYILMYIFPFFFSFSLLLSPSVRFPTEHRQGTIITARSKRTGATKIPVWEKDRDCVHVCEEGACTKAAELYRMREWVSRYGGVSRVRSVSRIEWGRLRESRKREKLGE